MNEERRAAVQEVAEFIRRAAPKGGIAWAKETEPYKTRIIEAQRKAADPTFLFKAAMKAYAGAFFAAFRAYFDMQHPGDLSPEYVRALKLSDIWHAGNRIEAVECTSELGRYYITPRRSNDPALQPSFSAAEISMLRALGVSDRLMVENGLIDANTSVNGAMAAIIATKKAFPGALVTEIKDCMGDHYQILPTALQD